MQKERLSEVLNFFEPVELKNFTNSSFLNDESSVGRSIIINGVLKTIDPSIRFELAFFTINQDLDEGAGDHNSPQKVREEFYALKKHGAGMRIVDFGNLKTGKNINETLYALQEVCSLFFYEKINVFTAGGTQLLTLGAFNALKEYDNNINLVHVDSRIDFAISEESVKQTYYLNTIVENEAANLYNIANVGYQTYLTSHKQINAMNEWYFENYRLGEVRSNMKNIEPVMRDGKLVSFDVSAIRSGEAPGQRDGSPNGFYAEEACQLARYAGISDQVQFFGFFEYYAKHDVNRQTAKLIAQALWYYLEGYLARRQESTPDLEKDFIKYEVQIDEIEFPIVFYKSINTDRWWLQVKTGNETDKKSEGILVACTEEDYRFAVKNEIPERWWINYKKLK